MQEKNKEVNMKKREMEQTLNDRTSSRVRLLMDTQELGESGSEEELPEQTSNQQNRHRKGAKSRFLRYSLF